LRAARADVLDVFFAPAYTMPLRLTVPTVVAIHDLSYLAHPEWFGWRSALRRRWLTKAAAARAALVLTGTEFARREIDEYLRVPADRVVVVPYGITLPPSADPAAPREPLVLFAGSIFNRRHVPDLIRAFARVVGDLPDARLIVAGENRTFPAEDQEALAASLGIAAAVQVRSYVSDPDLAALYNRARVFAFLSEYEGFGMTPLEALAAGVPSVVYDTAIAREAYGDAAVFVSPGDVQGVADALRRLLLDEAARQRILARAPAVLERYSWSRCADATLAALERAGRPR
jgi:glycosyltransferase involved in cell wall biosynthesis